MSGGHELHLAQQEVVLGDLEAAPQDHDADQLLVGLVEVGHARSAAIIERQFAGIAAAAPARRSTHAATPGGPLAAEPAAPASSPTCPTRRRLPELTRARRSSLGSLLGLVFGASSVYLALRVGLTVSASVPIAVLSITIFRALSRDPAGRPGLDPREHRRADHGLGGGVHRGGRGLHPARPGPARLRDGLDAHAAALALRRACSACS